MEGLANLVIGYMHPDYAESLREFGTPRQLPRCGGWIIERQIPGVPYRDGMGCYPLFACQDWSQLHTDLKSLENELITLSLVTDPFGDFVPAYLQRCFDTVIPFKEHFVTDLRCPMEIIVSKHHRKFARKALRKVQVERCLDPAQHLDEWVALYKTLANRHDIKGIRKFSRRAFAKQLRVPGMVMFRATYQGKTVGAYLIYKQGKVAYIHLSACSPIGYDLRAAYAISWIVIETLADELRWLNLGGGVGIKSKSTDGLSIFKKGWSTGTRTVYFCGCIFNDKKYSEIVRAKNITAIDYFPAYRRGEFE